METASASLFASVLLGEQDFRDLNPENQQALVQWAVPQGMAALLYHSLKAAGIDEDDYPVGESLREQSQVQYITYLWRMTAIGEVAGAFASAGIPLVFLKGFSVAHQVYELPHLRYSCDIDALVFPEDRVAAQALMQKLGFRLCATPRLSYENPLWIKYGHYYNFHRDGVDIDLRDMIYDTRALMKLSPEQNNWFTRQTRALSMKNGQVILGLNPELELLYACAHAFYHHVAVPTYKSLVDVTYLCQSGQLDWQRVMQAADRLGWQEALYFMLESAGEYFTLDIPEEVRQSLHGFRWSPNTAEFIRRLRKGYTLAAEMRSVDKKERLDYFWNMYLFPDKDYILENYPIRKSWQLPWSYLIYQISRLEPFFGIILRLRER